MSLPMNSLEIQQFQAVAHVFQHVMLETPAKEDISLYQQGQLAAEWPIFDGQQDLAQAIKNLDTFLQDWQGSAEEEVALQLDFTRLFCGPGVPLASPWGSIYLCNSKLLNDKSTQELQQFYHQHNITVSFGCNEPVDHLGLMFSVVAYLLGYIAEHRDAEYQQQVLRVLLEQHMLPFARRVFDLVAEHAETPFYQGLAVLGSHYLNQLAQRLNIIPLQRQLYH